MAEQPSSHTSRRKSASRSQAGAPSTAPVKSPRVSKAEYAAQIRHDSVEKQKELYSEHGARGKWERNHTPLAEIQEISIQQRGLPTAGARDVVKQVYGEINSKAFTLAQELFCESADTVVPGDHRRAAKVGDPHLIPKNEDPAAYSQLGLLYTRVPTSFAERTGIIPQERRSAKEVLAVGADVRVVTEAKRLMETVKPLGNRSPSRPNAAVLYFAPPTAAVEKRYAKVFGALGVTPSADAVGSILYTRQSVSRALNPTSAMPQKRTAQVFPTIDEAIRKTCHEETQYTQESGRIETLKNRWLQFAQVSLPAWVSERELTSRLKHCVHKREADEVKAHAEAMNGAIIKDYTELLESSIEFVKNAQHVEKSKIKERLERMASKMARSATGRLNPEPVLMQVEANYRLLQLRLEDIRIKNSFNHNDKALLRDVIGSESAVLSTVHESLSTLIGRLSGKERIFQEQLSLKPQYEREKNQMFWKLQVPRADSGAADNRLGALRVRPFTTFRDKILECSRHFEKNLAPGGAKEAAKALASMFLVTRAFKANRIIEDLRVALISPEQRFAEAFNSARAALEKLGARPHLFKKGVGVERNEVGKQFMDLFGELLGTVRRLQSLLLALQAAENSVNTGAPLVRQREELVETALDALAPYDFESFARRVTV